MNLVFVGWNHRGAPLDLRERLALSPERAREAMEGLFQEQILTEGVIVSTCNRAEIYGLSELEDDVEAMAGFFSRFHRMDAEVLRKTASAGRGDDTVRHLFRVASGLDSMVLGEAQILGQIREAHRFAAASRTARNVTNHLFSAALECGRRVRTETALGARPTSVPGIALSLAGRVFEELKDRRVLLIGAGETAELTARLLVEDGVTDLVFCNRSPERAEALAALVHGRTVPWDSRAAAVAGVDVVLSATGAPEPVVTEPALRKALHEARRRGPLLILDLAVPRDFDTAVDALPDVYRYDVDALMELARENAAARQAEVPRAEVIVEDAVRKFHDWYAGLLHVDVVKGLRARMEEIRKREIERYGGRLARLGEEDRRFVERLTESLISKILHNPTVALKDGNASDRLERAAVVRDLFKLDEGKE